MTQFNIEKLLYDLKKTSYKFSKHKRLFCTDIFFYTVLFLIINVL